MRYPEFLRDICPRLDLEWRKYRRREARRRVERRMAELGLADYAAFRDYLLAHPAEAAELPERMRVTVSRFFREAERWELLAKRVLPDLLGEVPPQRPLRLWSAGCCGGEEPYTLALLWLESEDGRRPGRGIEILATDIDRASLARARQGIYAPGSLREVPPELLRRYFDPEDGRYRLRRNARELVRFELRDLLQDPPPAAIDLACCRYLAFTYYRGERLLAAARRLHQALRPGGALMIARKEALGAAREFFVPWPDVPGVFRRRETNATELQGGDDGDG
jgi:chemotaxis methyl-accepting protein methylase